MLTVVLPVRDGAATLDAALASLSAQTLRPDRVLVVDDGSRDATASIAESWRARWPAIEVMRGPARGIAPALNVGVRRALERDDCRWVARMDADDVCWPERFAAQLAHARAEGLALVGTRVEHWGAVPSPGDSTSPVPSPGDSTSPVPTPGDSPTAGMRRHVDWTNSLLRHDDLALGLWIDSPLPHPTWLVAREVWKRVGFYDETPGVPEDYEWLHRFFAQPGLRAGKPAGPALLTWTDRPERLSRVSLAYAEQAFNLVKARALALRPRPSELHVLGLGPKGKTMVPILEREVGPLAALVDIHPRRAGTLYRGLVIESVDAWRARVALDPTSVLALICLGVPEARAECVAMCESAGLVAGRGWIAL